MHIPQVTFMMNRQAWKCIVRNKKIQVQVVLPASLQDQTSPLPHRPSIPDEHPSVMMQAERNCITIPRGGSL